MIGLHGDGMMSFLWMLVTKRSTVVALFEEGGLRVCLASPSKY